jgi:hypothetical protein
MPVAKHAMDATQLFAKGWISFGIDAIRPADSTYSGSDFDALPPLPAIRPNLEWLVPLHPRIEEAMQPYRPSSEDREEFVETCNKIIAIAKSEDVPLPDVFTRLMRAFELQDRIPSCTACYFDLPSGIMRSPFRSRD